MFCINCFNPKTAVTNSRTKSKSPAVWRRRHCPHCAHTFTTYERPALADTAIVSSSSQTETFNLGRLIISISKAFQHSPEAARKDSLWLAQTVEETLLTQNPQASTDDIAAVTHQILQNYDQLAAVQYAAQHQLISSTKRRPGRPRH
jgi:transcriptional repressor NrdR